MASEPTVAGAAVVPAAPIGAAAPAGRYPAIARACVHLNAILLALWAVYAAGPDLLGWLPIDRHGLLYACFNVLFFLQHFVLMSTAIIALFVVIIEIHAERPVRGFHAVLLGLGLPIASFLFFAARYLLAVRHWLER